MAVPHVVTQCGDGLLADVGQVQVDLDGVAVVGGSPVALRSAVSFTTEVEVGTGDVTDATGHAARVQHERLGGVVENLLEYCRGGTVTRCDQNGLALKAQVHFDRGELFRVHGHGTLLNQ